MISLNCIKGFKFLECFELFGRYFLLNWMIDSEPIIMNDETFYDNNF